jgi:hypothetical protein
MTTQTAAAVSVDAIDAALAAATRNLSHDDQRLAVAIFRLLAEGHPVTIPAAAQAAAIPEPRATFILRSLPAVFWDDHDQIAGFSGLALAGMPPHSIRHAGTDLSAWCAFDPLFLARIIGDLDVATADPVTGQAISYHISGDGAITGASHPDTALSFPARKPAQLASSSCLMSLIVSLLIGWLRADGRGGRGQPLQGSAGKGALRH